MERSRNAEAEGVRFERKDALGRIHLDRPKALNALTLAMAEAISERLADWKRDDAIAAVAITGEGRAFCAGGDIRAIYERGMAGEPFDAFFAAEYALDIAIEAYPKPIVSFVDGIAMGGGVGVGYHVPHVVVGESARFAMPECSIGFFPDVGGSHLLNRLVPGAGAFLGLTGTRLGPGDQCAVGLAHAFVPAGEWPSLLDALAQGTAPGEAIAAFAAVPPDRSIDWERIASEARGADPEQLIGEGGPWAEAAAAGDPLSLRVAARQLREGRGRSFAECMAMEARIAYRMLRERSFYEGIRASVIEKDHAPRWRHGSVGEVPDTEVARYFEPVPEGPLALLGGER